MTRRHAYEQPILPIRPHCDTPPDRHDDSADRTRQSTDEHGSHHGVESSFHNTQTYAMYDFGCRPEAQTYYGLPPPMSSDFQFSLPMEQPHYGEDADNLLTAWIFDEIADSGDVFDGSYYYVQEEFFTGSSYGQLGEHWGNTLTYQDQVPDPRYAGGASQVQASSSHEPFGCGQVLSASGPAKTVPLLQNAAPAAKIHRPIRPKGQAPHHDPLPDPSFGEENANVKGRKRALSPEGRQAARLVRSMRACGRCHAIKGKCETNRPCKPCKSRNKRSLDFPCMPELPQDRWTHLFTEELYGHLDLKSGGVIERMPKPSVDESNQPFVLRLHQYFNDPELKIPVVRFTPKTPGDLNKSVFPIASNGGILEVQPTDILSPPLVPAINGKTFARWTHEFRYSVRRWLDCAEIYDDIEWHLTFFREEHGKPWPREIFAYVCQYYHQVEWRACEALKSSLQSTVFAYLLGHSFYVPHEDIQDVLDRSKIETAYNGEFVFMSPIHVDRFIKAMLYPFFRVSVARSLKALQNLCAPNKHSKYARDQILATSIVILIVAGSQQSKAVEKAVASRRRGLEIEWGQVRSQICEIEEWIVNLILQLWEYKFPEDIRWASDDPQDRSPAFRAKIFRLFEKFQQSYRAHRDALQDLPTEVPDEIDTRTFGATNIDRVLKKFYECVFTPSRNSVETMTGKLQDVTVKTDPFYGAFALQNVPNKL